MTRLPYILIALASVGALCAATPGSADTWLVRLDGAGDAVTIQAAVDAAAPGDTVRVGPGTYAESILISGKNLTLCSIDGPEATVIDPAFAGRVLLLDSTGETVRLEGFTLTRGRAQGLELDNAGGAVAAYRSPLAIQNCRFFQNTAAGTGGAVYATFSPHPESSVTSPPVSLFLSVTGCRFESNFAAADGGGLYVCEVPSTVEDCRFEGNDAVLGGGAAFLHRNHTIADSEFTGNSALSGGGLSFVGNGSIRVERSEFRKNLADNYGGGVHAVGGIGFEMELCLFHDNQGRDGGGGALIETPLIAERVFWYGNTGTRSAGGVLLEDAETISLNRCTWLGNTASRGGSMRIVSGSVVVTGCLFLDEGAGTVDCGAPEAQASCNYGIAPGDCWPVSPLAAAACPSDDWALCPLPETACGTVGHAERSCTDPGCSTPVSPITWGRIKKKYTNP